MGELISVQDLHPLYADIERLAGECGLVVVPETPDTASMATVQYPGDWPDYIDLAARAGALLLYIAADRHDPEGLAALVAVASIRTVLSAQSPVLDDPEAWLHQRLREASSPWDGYSGRVGWISCVWCREGVAHHWDIGTNWHDACHSAVHEAAEAAAAVAEEDRTVRTDAAAVRLHQLATDLAHHPRFPEATSEAKRALMAERLFADEIAEIEKVSDDPHVAHSIARHAALIHWWDVEPAERATNTDRARDLRARGESIRNIAAILKMPESQVRAALEDESSIT